MDLRYTPEYDEFRREVRRFLEANWPLTGAQAKLAEAERIMVFRDLATEQGYLYRSIPRQYGGSEQPQDIFKSKIILEEFTQAGAPHELSGQGAAMLVPTLLECGNDAQKEQFIRPTIRGEMTWAQGYSEPGAGSDLASLQTRAELDGDEWVINGQKIWTSGADQADMMFCLVRTEPDAGKHAGISYLLVDLKVPGIRVRTLKQMTATDEFCEVFFDDARTPAANIVGKRGEGWAVSKATLMHERALIGDSGRMERDLAQLVKLARRAQIGGRPAIEDSSIRQRLAEIQAYVATQTHSGSRMLTATAHGEFAGIVMIMAKLTSTEMSHMMAKLALDLIGDGAFEVPNPIAYSPVEDGTDASWLGNWMWSLGIATAGGTANIQRNIIGERGLGLPKQRVANMGAGKG
ncbi:MAG: acyl-CoA dehydrogenase family protein [Deltaproteobacteria bacterium]|nr:acyl-CoA dehydrogenase family protein [Deltaproteobacteria bacterium]